MRIAISGAHATGKSTLARVFSDLRPEYSIVDEPYHVMVSEGFLFSDPPVFEDFEAQLERSASLLNDYSASAIIFERCPIDFLAYLASFRKASPEDIRRWLDVVRDAVQTIDLVAYVPIEHPDRIAVSSDEHLTLRRIVDRKLRSFLLDDGLGLALNVVELRGSVQQRAKLLLKQCGRA